MNIWNPKTIQERNRHIKTEKYRDLKKKLEHIQKAQINCLGKTTYEWHTNDIRVHTSDIRMTYEYIRVTYGWHTSTCEWHTDDIRVHTSDIQMTYEYIRVTYGWHTSTYEWHTDDIRVHTIYIRMTREWHTDDMRLERKIKLSFLKLFDNSLSKYLICKRILACNDCFGLFNKIKMGSGINFWCIFSAWFFHTNVPYLILYQFYQVSLPYLLYRISNKMCY